MCMIENHSDEAVWMNMARKEGSISLVQFSLFYFTTVQCSMQTEVRNVTKGKHETTNKRVVKDVYRRRLAYSINSGRIIIIRPNLICKD